MHPAPTATTIKELYGTATHCAFPNCHEPFYREVPGSGRVLNSEVCHINARSEGGPRWDPAQGAEENGSVANLVVCCFPHHAEIDGPAREADFPAASLREWKRRQIQDAAGAGYRLTEAEASEIARRALLHQPIYLNAAVIDLGGKGGAEHGAGGGGGAAVGAGARGGRGGDGGRTRFRFSGRGATAPGAGGGGAGARHLARQEWPTDIPRPNNGPTPAAHFVNGLRVTSLYLADFARRTRSGSVDALAAGCEWFEFQSLPAEIAVTIVCAVHMNSVAHDDTIILTAVIRDPDGTPALMEEFTLCGGSPPRPVMMPTALVYVRFTATRVGSWSLAITEGQQELGWIPFEVRFTNKGPT